jgi:uncharacterized protein (TIGR02145 family)
MVATLGGSTVAGGKMKETGMVHWGPYANTGASNSVGFTALPSGSSANGNFVNLRQYMNLWTTTKGTLVTAAWYFGATYAYPNNTTGETDKFAGQSIRCLMD